MAGRHIEDPQSVTVPFEGHTPQKPKAALVTKFENHTIDSANGGTEKAGKSFLIKAGKWKKSMLLRQKEFTKYGIWYSTVAC